MEQAVLGRKGESWRLEVGGWRLEVGGWNRFIVFSKDANIHANRQMHTAHCQPPTATVQMPKLKKQVIAYSRNHNHAFR
jgi:hypothetical protein